MGNLFSKVLLLFRHRTLCGGHRIWRCGRRPVLFPAFRDDGPPGRNHPAAPAHALRHGFSHPGRVRLSTASQTQWTRRACIPQAIYSFLRSLPLVTWKNPPKTPVLPTSNSRMFGPSRTIFIPPSMRKFTRPRSPPEQVVKSTMPVPSSTIPLPCSKVLEVKIQEEPKKEMAENEEHRVVTNEQDDQNSHQGGRDLPLTTRPPKTDGVVISIERSPGPLAGGPRHSQCSLSENAQMPPAKPDSRPAVPSAPSVGRPARDVAPPPKLYSGPAVLSAPSACCSLLPKRPTKEVLGEDHVQISPDPFMSGKETHSPKPSDVPSRSSSLVSASSRRHKHKMPMPLSLPLPPLQWDRGNLPVPCKLPCLAFDRNLDTLMIPTCRWNKIVEDKTKVKANCSATQSVPSFTPPGVVTDSLPQATYTGQVPATAPNSADLSVGPPTKSVPTHVTQNIDHFPLPIHSHSLPPLSSNHIWGIPSNRNGGRLHSVITTSISDLSTPAMTSFQPPSCNNESPIPMCVDSPPPALSLPTPLPVPSASLPLALPTNSVAVSSTSANGSASHSGQSTSDSDVTDMDTTPPPPFEVFVFTAASCPSRRSCKSQVCCKPQVYCRVANPPKSVTSTDPSASKYLRLVPNYSGSPQTTPQGTSRTSGNRKSKTSLLSAAVSTTNAPLVNSAVTQAPANNTSANPIKDWEPMDTTPPP
ncbi:nuclear pore-associated protein 1 [Rhinolophus sinicus]|uniref:nuclear pore-associated protein 1 n=1 Tax=Rhinolophus sinicus TaxID=89399 RepID=UPI003D7A5D04